jgi:hypothetical protein
LKIGYIVSADLTLIAHTKISNCENF